MKTKTPPPSFRRIIAVTALVLTLGSGHAMAQRASGIDVSRWQGTIDWTSVKGSGVTFAWSQATRGAYLVNANFTANMSNGKAAGVLMGAYHFAFPATNSPSTEANYFWATAGPYIKADGKTLMPMLDIETFSGYVGASSYSDWANQWYNAVVAKAAAAGVTIKPVLYSSSSFMCNFNSSCSGFGSWMANYNGQSSQTGTPWSCCTSCNLWGGGAWNFWQYTSTGSVPGISGNVDLDVFNGTTAQLSTWVATAGGVVSDIIIDNPAATIVGSWSTGTTAVDRYGSDYRFKAQGTGSAYLQYKPTIVTAGNYQIYEWHSIGSNRTTGAPHVISYNGGSVTINVNQQLNGGRWNLLGTFNLVNGAINYVRITDGFTDAGQVAIADAIKFVYVP